MAHLALYRSGPRSLGWTEDSSSLSSQPDHVNPHIPSPEVNPALPSYRGALEPVENLLPPGVSPHNEACDQALVNASPKLLN